MPRWKTTENILSIKNDGEYFDENWMNYDRIHQYAPVPILWDNKREIRFEDVDLWEVIVEESNGPGLVGVYAAYQPYEEYYVVFMNWSLTAEFKGIDANKRLEQFLKQNNINYPYEKSNHDHKKVLEKFLFL